MQRDAFYHCFFFFFCLATEYNFKALANNKRTCTSMMYLLVLMSYSYHIYHVQF